MKKRTTKRTRETNLEMHVSSRGEIIIGKYNLDLEAAKELQTWLNEAIKFVDEVVLHV